MRLRAVDAVESGVHPEDVAASLGMGRGTVYGWLVRLCGPGTLSHHATCTYSWSRARTRPARPPPHHRHVPVECVARRGVDEVAAGSGWATVGERFPSA